MKSLKIPEATIMRLSVYSRFLSELLKNEVNTVSSNDIAEGTGVSSAQVRKDLAYFGEFGTRGVGYNVPDLLNHILKILGLNSVWRAVIVGAGHLGSALSMYGGFRDRGFNITALFDTDESKIGQKINNIPIYNLSELCPFIEKENVDIGIITVPAPYAQDIADTLLAAGVKGILNFAPVVLNVPNEIELRNVDLSVNLEVLTFNLNSKK